MSPYNQLIEKVNCNRGAPMGRYSEEFPKKVEDGRYVIDKVKMGNKTIFDQRVPLPYDGAYDKGGAYWGCGAQLRVMYTKDLSYYQFYRVDNIPDQLKPYTKWNRH